MASSDPIRLALVITELEPGGAERSLAEIATRLDRARFAPAVYSLGPRPPAGKDLLVTKLTAAQIPTRFLDLRGPIDFFRGVRRLAEMLREQQAELVQTFLFHANVIGSRAAVQVGVPFLTGLRVADARRWRTSLERWTTRAARRHVCVSQSVADFYRQRGFPSARLIVIPNGIDVAVWRDARPIDLTQLGVPAGRRVFVFVGRLAEQKGLAPFFQELPAAFRELSDHDLLLVGDGPDRVQLAETAQRLGVAERVHFAGWRPDVPQILAAADMLILPSHWEGMPNVILEAMAAARPVVASRAEGVAELLGDGTGEQTVPTRSAVEFRERLTSLLAKRDSLKLMGSRNQERAIQQFSIENSRAAYERLYSAIART